MEKSISIMLDRIVGILSNNNPSVYLFGSVVLDDFKPGWSDIDILCLTEKTLTEDQSEILVNLRQALLEEYPGNPYFRSFEGGFLSWDSLVTKAKENVVYWGTSGQRITDKYEFDPFSTIELLKYGKLLYGSDHRERLPYPSKREIITAVNRYYDIIRKHAIEIPGKINSCGWLLDIARCLYTLETWDVIAKTKAGEWAIRENIAPNKEILSRVTEIRKNPKSFSSDNETLNWISTLGPHIQDFADVLEKKLKSF